MVSVRMGIRSEFGRFLESCWATLLSDCPAKGQGNPTGCGAAVASVIVFSSDTERCRSAKLSFTQSGPGPNVAAP